MGLEREKSGEKSHSSGEKYCPLYKPSMILYLIRCCPHARATYECALFVPHRCEHCVRIRSPVCGWPVGEWQLMSQTTEMKTPTLDDAIASCQSTANALNQTIRVNIGGIDMEFSPSNEPAQKPAATKPKAATPTKREPKANAFYEEVIVGGYATRQMRKAWAATKGKNMIGVPLDIAQRNGWASKKTGKVTKKGAKAAKPTRTTTWA